MPLPEHGVTPGLDQPHQPCFVTRRPARRCGGRPEPLGLVGGRDVEQTRTRRVALVAQAARQQGHRPPAAIGGGQQDALRLEPVDRLLRQQRRYDGSQCKHAPQGRQLVGRHVCQHLRVHPGPDPGHGSRDVDGPGGRRKPVGNEVDECRPTARDPLEVDGEPPGRRGRTPRRGPWRRRTQPETGHSPHGAAAVPRGGLPAGDCGRGGPRRPGREAHPPAGTRRPALAHRAGRRRRRRSTRPSSATVVRALLQRSDGAHRAAAPGRSQCSCHNRRHRRPAPSRAERAVDPCV